jgi:methylmalonyl-CoA mutase cobalamin-binding subunit
MEIKTIGVVGAGQMGGGIAQVVAASGRRVSLYDSQPGATERALEVMEKSLARLAAKGGPPAAEVLVRVSGVDEIAAADLMVEAVLSLEGAQCISLGTQMPLMEIVDAVAAHQVDVVALSFSAAFPARQTRALLEQLRAALPGATELWAGGAGVRKLAAPVGVICMASLDSAIAAVSRWRLRAN